MLEEYNTRPNTFKRQVIATGTTDDMFKFEATLLSSADAKNDLMFYNRSNGMPTFDGPHTNSAKLKLRNKHLGRVFSVATKGKMSANHADVSGVNNPAYGKDGGFKGKFHTEEHRLHMSKVMSGKERSVEHSRNISLAKKGKPSKLKGIKYETKTCPHCGVVGGGGNMTKHHFDNCKNKVIN